MRKSKKNRTIAIALAALASLFANSCGSEFENNNTTEYLRVPTELNRVPFEVSRRYNPRLQSHDAGLQDLLLGDSSISDIAPDIISDSFLPDLHLANCPQAGYYVLMDPPFWYTAEADCLAEGDQACVSVWDPTIMGPYCTHPTCFQMLGNASCSQPLGFTFGGFCFFDPIIGRWKTYCYCACGAMPIQNDR